MLRLAYSGRGRGKDYSARGRGRHRHKRCFSPRGVAVLHWVMGRGRFSGAKLVRDLNYVQSKVSAGKTIKFYRDFYGKHYVEIRTAWIWRVRISLPDHEIVQVKDALHQRRRARLAKAA